jgi:hypothetical protein
MKATSIISYLLALCPIAAACQPAKAIARNESELVKFAEKVIITDIILELSERVREERHKCALGCGASSAMELAIGTIGLAKGEAGATALMNLLGVRLDGGAAYTLSCQILLRRSQLQRRLKHFPARRAVHYCHASYAEAMSLALREVHDVPVTQVCSTEAQFEQKKADLLSAFRSRSQCE